MNFRIWDKKEKRYKGDNLASRSTWLSLIEWDKRHKEFIVELCSGLKDKTGKDIYEGDRLEIKHPNDGEYYIKVVFKNGAFCNEEGVDIYSMIIHEPGGDYEKNISEVVGNIHSK